VGKVISQFLPAPYLSPDECERHYTEVHMDMGTGFLRSKPAVVSYHVNKALWQADNAGAFRRRPDAWRLVLIRFKPGAHMEFSPEENETITEEQTFCMYRLRAFDVDEEILWDGRVDCLGLTKYVIDIERPESVSAEASLSAFNRLADRLAELAGARRCSAGSTRTVGYVTQHSLKSPCSSSRSNAVSTCALRPTVGRCRTASLTWRKTPEGARVRAAWSALVSTPKRASSNGRGRLPRTQKVAGSSPASSIRKLPQSGCIFRMAAGQLPRP
jgi:hypothetical protein